MRIFCHRRATTEIKRTVGAIPIFRHQTWSRKRHVSALSSMNTMGAEYAKDCQKIDRICGSDIILVPTAQENQVLGLALYLKSLPIVDRPRVVLNFHVDNMSTETERANATRKAFSLLNEVNNGRVIVTAPIAELAESLALVSGPVKPRVYPLPQNYDLDTVGTIPGTTSIHPTVAVLGRPLKRKGTSWIADIISNAHRKFGNAHFLVQSGVTNANLLGLAFKSRIHVKIGGLSPQDYAATLNSADILLLPYVPEDYKSRTSGIFADCAAFGKIAVVPKDTWMARNIQNGNAAGVIFDPDSPIGAHDALSEALTTRDELLDLAKPRSLYWRQHQSASAYINQLIADLNTSNRSNLNVLKALDARRKRPAPSNQSLAVPTIESVL